MNTRTFSIFKVIISFVLSGFGFSFIHGQYSEPRRLVNRIVGGTSASRGEFPYLVSLQTFSRHYCGGAIIGERWVVTAAHCARSGSISVVAGKHNIKQSEDTEQRIQVQNVFIHEGYSGPVAPYDIALLKLAHPLQYNQYVEAVGLPSAGTEPSGTATLSGWGSVSRTEERIMPTYLQQATVPIIDRNICSQMLEEASPDSPFTLTDDNICTGPGYTSTSSCNGDSGGPLVTHNELVGITSWGTIPCEGKAPTAYTKVSSFVGWIQDVIANN